MIPPPATRDTGEVAAAREITATAWHPIAWQPLSMRQSEPSPNPPAPAGLKMRLARARSECEPASVRGECSPRATSHPAGERGGLGGCALFGALLAFPSRRIRQIVSRIA